MNSLKKIYKGHQLIARQQLTGWQVEIGSTGFKSSFHSEPGGAFAEAEKWVGAHL
jgi:hypothetical protein